MNAAAKKDTAPDQPLLDTTPYGDGPGDSVIDVSENAAITQHTRTLDKKSIAYTARTGHLVTTDI